MDLCMRSVTSEIIGGSLEQPRQFSYRFWPVVFEGDGEQSTSTWAHINSVPWHSRWRLNIRKLRKLQIQLQYTFLPYGGREPSPFKQLIYPAAPMYYAKMRLFIRWYF